MRGTPNWGEFERPQAGAADEASPERDQLAVMVMRATLAGDGKALLAWLRSITIERRVPPGAPDAVLRELEAQRRLVFEIERLAAEGRASLDRRNTAAAKA